MREKKGLIILTVIQILLVAAGIAQVFYAQGNLTEETYTGAAVPLYGEQQLYAPTGTVLELHRGSYEVELTYTTEQETVLGTFMDTPYGQDYADKVVLLKEANEKIFDLMLYHNVTKFHLVSDEPSLQIDKIVIRETARWNMMLCTMLILGLILVDVFLWQKHKGIWENSPAEKKTAFLAVFVIAVLASLPLFSNYLLSGPDLPFHLMRIEGIAEGLRQGDFPVKMQPLWVNGHGYPVSVMYGDALLYLPALLRLAGFTVQTAYKIYVFGIALLTAAVALRCGETISKSTKIGILVSAVYTLSGYRLTSAFGKAAVGEVTAMAFFPVVFWGLWMLFTREEKRSLKRGALLLVIGYTGLLESHLLSFEMGILFSVFYCLLNWRIFIKRLRILIPTAVFTIGLNLFYLVPFLDYMLTQDLHVLHTQGIGMQSTGLFLPQMMQMFASENEMLAPVSYGMGKEGILGVGFPMAVMTALYLWEILVYKKKLVDTYGIRDYRQTKCLLYLTVGSLLLSSYVFPWGILENIPEIGTLLVPYQFPMRFSAIALTFGLMLGAYAFRNLKVLVDGTTVKLISMGLAMLAVLHVLFFSGTLLKFQEPIKITAHTGIDTRNAVISGEYLLENTYAGATNEEDPQPEEGVVIQNYEKRDGKVTISLENHTGKDSYVKVPFFAYKGYRAVDEAAGRELTVWHDFYNVAMIVLPKDYQGTFCVFFEEPVYWNAAEAVSLLVLLGGVAVYLWKRKETEEE